MIEFPTKVFEYKYATVQEKNEGREGGASGATEGEEKEEKGSCGTQDDKSWCQGMETLETN